MVNSGTYDNDCVDGGNVKTCGFSGGDWQHWAEQLYQPWLFQAEVRCLRLLLSVFISRRAYPYWDHSWPFALWSNTWYNGTKQDPCSDKELFITQDHSLKDGCAPWRCISFYHNLNFLWHILTLPPHFFILSGYQIIFFMIFVKTSKMHLKVNINNNYKNE